MILRRGPSKHVEVIRWDLARDVFERGQWFRGRIFEKRSDLSPDGGLLVYFAAKYASPSDARPDALYAWTAVSRAPWLTALALWPKTDTWWGGGLFTGARRLWLNHPPEHAQAHPDHQPHGLSIATNPEAQGENEPIYRRRLERDGWILRQEWEVERARSGTGYTTLVPEQRVKHAPADAGLGEAAIIIERRIDRFRDRELFRIEGVQPPRELPPGPLDWMDWDPAGRIIALSGGRIWAARVEGSIVQRFIELIDLRGDVLQPREPPASATAPLD